MPNPSSIFSFKRSNPVAGFVLFVVLVLVIETVLAFMPQNSLIAAIGSIQMPAKSPDIQIMGDSVAQGGISSGQLSSELGGADVTNLAVAATGPEFPYFLLKRQLAAGVAPKEIVYSPSPHTFGTRRIALLIGAYATWPEVAEISTAGIEPFEVLYGVLCKVSFSLRNREQLSELLKGRKAPEGFQQAPTNSGGVTANVDRFPARNLHPMFKKPFEVTDFNGHFHRKFLATAAANGIKVNWVSVPSLEVVREARKAFDYEASYREFLRGVRDEFSIRLVMPESTVMEPRFFKDYSHLNSEGAAVFTKSVADALKAR